MKTAKAHRSFGWFAVQASAALLLFCAACTPAEPPATRETVVLEGSAYDRGFQHGQKLKSKVRSFYGRLLASSILPNLNREQPDLSAVFAEYQKERYQNGQFSFQLLLDSAQSLEHSIPRAYRDEMHGIADGAEVPYEQVLVTNTFLDSLLAIRSVAITARLSGAPHLERVQLLGAATDGADNDGDGTVDEADEADFPYQASARATAVELPENVKFRFTLMDPDGVDPQTVRITLDGKVYAFGDPALTAQTLTEDPTRLEATLTPSEPLSGPIVSLLVQAGDLKIQTDPPPAHAHFMRDERLAFTIRGAGLRREDVWNEGDGSSKEHAPSFAFAARGTMTSDGAPVLAHQFALLDGNTAHEHTVLFIHHPDSGPEFAVVGWAGIVWGMSGMNKDGLTVACNPADTLDNSVVNGLFGQIADLSSAKLIASGTPIGIFERQALEQDGDVAAAVTRAKATKHTFGWSCLFADKANALRAIEVDSDFDKNGGVFDVGTEDTDSTGARLASVSGDDLRVASHFRWNEADIPTFTVAGQRVQPERAWSSFYFRSLTAWSQVGEELSSRRGRLNADAAIEILRMPALVDQTDSMNAVVYEPAQLRMRVAIGTEPAADSEFIPFSFNDEGVAR